MYGNPDDENSVVVETKADYSSLLEQNRTEYNANEGERWGDMKKVASIPLDLYWDLKKRGIIDDKQKFRAWLNDPENRYFRTFPGRV